MQQLDQLIDEFVLASRAAGLSEKTISWYTGSFGTISHLCAKKKVQIGVPSPLCGAISPLCVLKIPTKIIPPAPRKIVPCPWKQSCPTDEPSNDFVTGLLKRVILNPLPCPEFVFHDAPNASLEM